MQGAFPVVPRSAADLSRALLKTQAELASVKRALGTLIAWMAQSANSPISGREAEQLIAMLPPEK